jgi:polysaccharide deacetylase family protein (PEP-CTERM system associated)
VSLSPRISKFPPRSVKQAPAWPASRASTTIEPRSIFSVDVEDWFHILEVHSVSATSVWDQLPSRVERNFHRLLDLFSEKDVQVTCFFLGWVGERFPGLVREAVRRGHEIASHGYAHRLVYEMTGEEFYQDALRSKNLLEDIAGAAVLGYRSAGFSLTKRTPWFFERLAAAGYQYDSSVFPSRRAHGGMPGGFRAPHVVREESSQIIEFPISVADIGGESLCFFGGGYLRLFPYWMIRTMARQVLGSGRPLIFYVHPREIDPEHPRLEMSWIRQFKSYVNLHNTEFKIRRILDEFPVSTFQKFLQQHDGHSLQSIA